MIDRSEQKTEYDSIHVARPTAYALQKLEKDIAELLVTDDKIGKLQEIVVEFNHQTHKEGKVG